ncbi:MULTISPECIES: caspase family protein [unclassified Mesorhizobium]|uniref:caspase family protein n=1 Tax=unclassified Mesorhizobium TaxID=325217 RepID=UPI0033389D40
MTAKLQALGFEVVAGEDLDLSGMRGTVRDFIGKLDGADMALLYAGHGVQVNGTNYMAPVDARLSTYNDLDFEAVPMDLVLSVRPVEEAVTRECRTQRTCQRPGQYRQ